MLRAFDPLIRNPHLLTIAGNFWRRSIDQKRFPAKRRSYRISLETTIVVLEHHPQSGSRGAIVLLHGLEGSADAGYIASMSQNALARGFSVHRVNFRTCGGTEELCQTMYHSGLTGDTEEILKEIRERTTGPTFLIGFSLGGNVALKLAGELGQSDLLYGVCAVSTPIDLAVCVKTLDKPSNKLYARRFLSRLRSRVRRKNRLTPDLYGLGGLDEVKTIWDFDDNFTAPLFGFGTAANYYATQSAMNFLDRIRIPTLVIAAKDDPIVPFEIYSHQAFRSNPALKLIASDAGGHLGFLSAKKPRFWVDEVTLDWIEQLLSAREAAATNGSQLASA